MPPRRRLAALILALAAGLAAGCTQETRDGDTTVVSFEPWVGAAGLLAGVAAVPVGLLVRRWRAGLGWGLVVVGPLLAVLVAPGVFMDKVTVSPERFRLETGLWFDRTIREARYADVVHMALTAEERVGRRGRSVSYTLECRTRSGGVVAVPVGDLMKRGGLDRIVEMARLQGVPVEDRTGGR